MLRRSSSPSRLLLLKNSDQPPSLATSSTPRESSWKYGIHASSRISARVRYAFRADARDCHANAAETSLMLALDPAMVRADRLADADDPDSTGSLVFAHPVNRTSRNGVTGKPSGATAADGERLHAFMVADLAAVVRAGLLEEPPLPHGYGERAVGFERARQR